MEFLEKNLEEIIWESDNNLLSQRGLTLEGVLKRQLRIGEYGIADIVEFTKEYEYHEGKLIPYLLINVLELKKDKIGISAFFQALNYIKGIKTYLEIHKPDLSYAFKLTLIGRDIDKTGSFIYLPELFRSYDHLNVINKINFYTYTYHVDGIRFKNEIGYNLINTGF